MRKQSSPALWNSKTHLTCCRGRECADYCHQYSIPRPARTPVLAIVQQRLHCPRCQNVFCAVCMAAHSQDACQKTPEGSITREQLEQAVNRKPGNMAERDNDSGSRAGGAAPAAAAAAAEVVQLTPAKKGANSTPAAAPAAAAAAGSSAASSTPACSQSGSARLPNPAAWISSSWVACCRRKECAAYGRGADGRYRAARNKVSVVVQQGLYCSDCRNVFCSLCKAAHTQEACLLTPRGSLTEEQLLAAVSVTGGREGIPCVTVVHVCTDCTRNWQQCLTRPPVTRRCVCIAGQQEVP